MIKKKLIKSALFLGAGGVSMSRIAKAYIDMGVNVYAYDRARSQNLNGLKKCGAKTTNKFCDSFTNVDICIRSPAVPNTNRYVSTLTQKNIPIIDRIDALNDLSKSFGTVIAVAGTHGKSTTAALIFHILKHAGESVSCHIGADVDGERFSLGDKYLVVEACEYNKSFLHLNPDIAVVTNVEADHMDTYHNMFDMRVSFIKFVKKARLRYAFDTNSNKFLSGIRGVNFVSSECEYKTKLSGEYNKQNIALAVRVCHDLGVSDEIIRQAVEIFNGVGGRNEYIGECYEAKAYIDYAHHPTEIECFISGFIGNDCQIVFQPHTYSRTKYLFDEFVRVLNNIDNLIIYKEYPARENKSQGVSAYQLYKAVRRENPNVKYANCPKRLKPLLLKQGKIAFVGAGDISRICKKLTTNLTKTVDKT